MIFLKGTHINFLVIYYIILFYLQLNRKERNSIYISLVFLKYRIATDSTIHFVV